MSTIDSDLSETQRLRYGLFVILAGFVLVLGVAGGAMWRWSAVSDVAAIIGAVTGLVGAVVGVFFGIQAGAAGSHQAERGRREAELARARAELRALRLAGAMDPVRAETVLSNDTV
jgi:hypothetical protein